MKTMEQENAETVARFIEDEANRGLLDSSDQAFAAHMLSAFTERQYAIDEILAQDKMVIARLIVTAVHSGDFAGHAATGRKVQITHFHEFSLVDGKIAEQRGWFDTGTLLPQIQLNQGETAK